MPSVQGSSKGLTNRTSLALADIDALPSLVSDGAKNTTLQSDRCFVPLPGLRVIKTQDALIALSQLARGNDFDQPMTWFTTSVLGHHKTASITLFKYGLGYDIFSKHDLALKAIVIFWHCVIQDPNGLGGRLHVGSMNVFSLVFQSPVALQNLTSEGSEDG